MMRVIAFLVPTDTRQTDAPHAGWAKVSDRLGERRPRGGYRGFVFRAFIEDRLLLVATHE
jgi:hypothetical protein